MRSQGYRTRVMPDRIGIGQILQEGCGSCSISSQRPNRTRDNRGMVWKNSTVGNSLICSSRTLAATLRPASMATALRPSMLARPTGSGCYAGSTAPGKNPGRCIGRYSPRPPWRHGHWLPMRHDSGQCASRCATACAPGDRNQAPGQPACRPRTRPVPGLDEASTA